MPRSGGAAALYSRLESKQIPGLDGVRMIAVFLVMLYHFGIPYVPGARGVTMFFVLSGFLITWLLLKEQAATGTVSVRDFYWRRALRIFPAFYAFWLLLVAEGLLRDGNPPSAHSWSAFFYVSNYYSALNDHPVNGFSHTWSLGVEEQFYLLWPAVFIWLSRDLRRLTHALVGLIAGISLYRVVLAYGLDVTSNYIYSAFETRVDNLLVGCLAAVVVYRRSWSWLWDRACGHWAMPLLTIAGVMASLQVWRMDIVPRYQDVLGYLVDPLLFALFIPQVITLSGTKAWSWLDSAPARFLGRISYPLYLYQQVTLYRGKVIAADYPVWVQLGVAVALTVVVAAGSYYLIERPFLRLKRRFSPVDRLGVASGDSGMARAASL